MTPTTAPDGVSTHFAPAERADHEQLTAARRSFLSNDLAFTMLESIPDPAMVLTTERQIIAVNARLLQSLEVDDAEAVLGQRMGELVQCVHAHSGPGGWGTSAACQVCGGVQAIVECLDSMDATGGECRVRTRRDVDGGALDLEVQASPIVGGDQRMIVVAMRDISSEKRRGVLERVFFHDVLNVASGLQAVAQLLEYGDDDPEAEAEYRRDLMRMSEQLAEEITVQRQLLAAERGELELELSQVDVREMLESVTELYRHHTVARDRTLEVRECPEGSLSTDATLLRRVLGNLVKNALEASAKGHTVVIDAEDLGNRMAFHITNPGFMPPDVQKQIFQRSFSTKGGSGRGIGTHSVKLLTERYLGGEASFTSTDEEGTTFTVALPTGAAG